MNDGAVRVYGVRTSATNGMFKPANRHPMSAVNQIEISAILHSEIVGTAEFGHGQIASFGDAQKYVDLVHVAESPDMKGKQENGNDETETDS